MALRDLVEAALADEPDLAITALAADEVDLLLAAAEADVAVISMRSGALPAVTERLLDEYPRLGVVCVDVEVGGALVCHLRPFTVPIADASPAALAAAIRSVASEPAEWGYR